AQREMNQVGAFEVGPRTVIAERRHARDDQGGVLPHQSVRAQTQPVELTARRRLQHDIGGGDERAELLAVALLTQIEHDRALPAVVLPEEQRALGIFAVLVEGTESPGGGSAGRLDLDDVGAEPRERQSTVFRLLVGQLDDTDAGERATAGNGTPVASFHEDSPISRCERGLQGGFYATRRSYRVPIRPRPVGTT